ncbi:MAG: hypothetical protein FWE48_06660 [Coriobacteriia bacterium]|nr:hypothetical protein [Coriobacteriia bacterium]
MRNSLAAQPISGTRLKSDVRGQNYDYLFLESEDDFFAVFHVEDTMVMAQGLPEGIDAIYALLKAIGYQ